MTSGEEDVQYYAKPRGHERGCLRYKHKISGDIVSKRTKFKEWSIPVMSNCQLKEKRCKLVPQKPKLCRIYDG